MNNINIGDIIVTVCDMWDYCDKGKAGVVTKLNKDSEYPYTVLIEKREFYFGKEEIKKVGGLFV
jgi:hypothetical protein|nr:MAG TPA: hypothetical protein [Caudoviricetes sp.]